MHLSRRAALAGALAATTGMSPDQRVAVLGGAAGPALSLNFLSGALDSRITFTRASTAWEFDSTGTLVSFSSNVPRFGYNPTTLAARGLLIEEARTNSIRNNSMTGAVVSGALPTNWTQSNNTGLAATVVATGTDHGLPYIDLRINGTTATGTANNIVIETPTGIAAVQNQIWTGSQYVSLTAGSLSNVASVKAFIQPLNSSNGALTSSSITIIPTGSSLASQRSSLTYTLPDAATAFVRTLLSITSATAPVVVDLTLRIGAPQLELGSFATSPILTTSAAVTRAADVASMPLASGPAFSFAVEAEVDAPTTFSLNQFLAQLDDGSAANRVVMYRALSTGASSASFISASSNIFNPAQAVISQGATLKSAAARADSLSVLCTNGGAVTSSSAAGVIAKSTTLRLGNSSTSISQLNGYLQRVRYWTRALSNGELQAATT